MNNNLLHGDLSVILSNGKSLSLREIVKDRIRTEVISIDKSGNIGKSNISGWVKQKINTDINKFKHIESRSIEGQGRYGITGTAGLKIYTNKDWLNIEEVRSDHKLYSKYVSKFNGTLKEFLSGILCCDSYVQVKGNSGYLKLQDSNNVNYVKWKIMKLNEYFTFKTNIYHAKNKQFTKFVSNSDYELKRMKISLFSNRSPEFMLKEISPISLAIMIMDDGCFDDSRERYILSFKRFKGSVELENISKLLSTLGFEFSYGYENVFQKNGSIIFNKDSSRKIAEDIYKFVPNCMQYKLPEDLRDKYVDFKLYSEEKSELELTDITEIRYSSKKQDRENYGYNLILEHSDNFLSGGCRNGVFVSSRN